MKTIELKPIRESKADWDEVERRLIVLFKTKIYYPVLQEAALPKTLMNDKDGPVISAIKSGRIQFYRGAFTGKFSGRVSSELKSLGAVWDKKLGVWKLPRSSFTREMRNAVDASETAFARTASKIDSKLAQLLPEEIAEALTVTKIFDQTIWKTEKKFKDSVRGITIAPELTNDEIQRLSKEWAWNLKLFVRDFSEEHIADLREKVQKSVYAGNRRDFLAAQIQKSFGVSVNKAKFLARQETNLLMAKFKQVRYQSAGVNDYKWVCVNGSPAHPVRPDHKALGDRSKKGETFKWTSPPLKTKSGPKNPGEDYNCRCTAVPVVRF